MKENGEASLTCHLLFLYSSVFFCFVFHFALSVHVRLIVIRFRRSWIAVSTCRHSLIMFSSLIAFVDPISSIPFPCSVLSTSASSLFDSRGAGIVELTCRHSSMHLLSLLLFLICCLSVFPSVLCLCFTLGTSLFDSRGARSRC